MLQSWQLSFQDDIFAYIQRSTSCKCHKLFLRRACGRNGRALAGEWDNLPTRCRFGGQHVNQSRNRGWEKEGEGGEFRTGEGGGMGDIEGTCRFGGQHVNQSRNRG